jgi:hypothetical protein
MILNIDCSLPGCDKLQNEIEYLKKYFSFMNFIDRISLVGMKDETAPWNSFDREQVFSFQKTFESYQNRTVSKMI